MMSYGSARFGMWFLMTHNCDNWDVVLQDIVPLRPHIQRWSGTAYCCQGRGVSGLDTYVQVDNLCNDPATI